MRKQVIITRKGALGDVIWTEPIISYFLESNYYVKLISQYSSIFKDRPNLEKKDRLSYFQSHSSETFPKTVIKRWKG